MLFDFVRRGPMKHPDVPVRPAQGLMNGSIDHSRHVVHSALQIVRLSLRCGQAASSALSARGMHRWFIEGCVESSRAPAAHLGRRGRASGLSSSAAPAKDDGLQSS